MPGVAAAAPVDAALGAVYGTSGGALGGTRTPYQWFLCNEYLNASHKALFTPQTRAYAPRNKHIIKKRVEIVEVDVPFQMVIDDLYFEGMWQDTRILVIEATFSSVRTARRKDHEPAEVNQVDITSVLLVPDDKRGKQRKKYIKQCEQDDHCILFEPEV